MSRSKRLSEGEAAKALALSLNKGSGSEASLNSPEQRLERIEACANVSGDQDMGDLDWLLRVTRAAVAFVSSEQEFRAHPKNTPDVNRVLDEWTERLESVVRAVESE